MAPLKQKAIKEGIHPFVGIHDRKVMAPLKPGWWLERYAEVMSVSMTERVMAPLKRVWFILPLLP